MRSLVSGRGRSQTATVDIDPPRDANVAVGSLDEPRSPIVVREATADDAHAIEHVYVETAREQYKTIVTHRVLQQLPARHLARRWELLLASRRRVRSACIAATGNGHVVGFAAAGPIRVASLGPAGEIYAIYVLPSWQRFGLGRLLFHRAVESLSSARLETVAAWVIAANPSRRFFESLGGTVVASATSRSGLTKVAYGWGEWQDSWFPIPMREASTRHA
jgi:GNAT superfamily N-acetyltransferase